MKMQMPDGEIITCYRKAKDREEQIGILADRNLCKKSQMREYLITLGLDVPVKKRHKATGVPKKPPMDEIRTETLPEEPAIQNDEEEGTDCRGPAGLAMTEKEDEAPQRMGLRGLLHVLQDVEKAFPEAEVELYEEGTLAGVGVIVDYTADGTPGHTTVRLIGER